MDISRRRFFKIFGGATAFLGAFRLGGIEALAQGKGPPEARLILFVNNKGEVIKAVSTRSGLDLRDDDYKDEKKRIVGDGRLASKNWCCWEQVNGRWKCIPC